MASAYSLTAISASVADLRLRASTLITGMCAGSVNASRTALTGFQRAARRGRHPTVGRSGRKLL
ncbi:hypothetical protein T621_03516 [Mycobacterium tuberculosis UT0112]|nr:hypothetical protein T621_03516 [Mycobacterium tuberculosis UT0112]